MSNRATHIIRFSSVIYGTPKQRNNLRSVIVRIYAIYLAVCVCAFKHFVGSFANMLTRMAGLRTVSRINHNKFNPIEQSLIFKFCPQVAKIPFAKFCSKLFVSTLRSKPNVSKVFNGNSFTLFFSRFHNRFTDCMVNQISRCPLLATKPFRQSSAIPFSGTLRSVCLCLNRTTNFLPMFTISIKPLGRMVNTIRSCNQSCQTKVTTDKLLNIFNISFWNINSLKKVELAFFVNQIGFSFNVRHIVSIMANKRYFNPTSDSPKRNNVIRLIGHNTTIITNASKWSEYPLNLFVKFVSISNLCNATYQYLTAKFKSGFKNVVGFMMEFKVIEYTLFPSNIRNGITNSVGFLHRFKKQVSLFISRQKFYFQREFHNANIQKVFLYQKNILILSNNLKALACRLPPTH